jgi:hypothetical protein
MKLAKNIGQLHCPMCPAKLPMDDVNRLVSEEVRQSLKAAVQKGMEAMMIPRIEKDYADRLRQLEQNIKDRSVADQVAREEQYVVEDLINIKCPRCNAVFDAFDGCFAFKCHRCAAGICGWCMADCGDDAHAHVRQCKINQGHGDFFGTMQQFQKLRNAERKVRILQHLRSLEPSLRALLKPRLNKHLMDHGVKL